MKSLIKKLKRFWRWLKRRKSNVQFLRMYIRYGLLYAGFGVNKVYFIFRVVCCCILFSVIIAGHIISFLNTANTVYKIESLLMLLAHLILFMAIITFYSFTQMITSTMSYADENSDEFIGVEETRIAADFFVKEVFIQKVFFCSLMFFGVVPVTRIMILETETDDADCCVNSELLNILPFLFSCGDRPRNHTFPCWRMNSFTGRGWHILGQSLVILFEWSYCALVYQFWIIFFCMCKAKSQVFRNRAQFLLKTLDPLTIYEDFDMLIAYHQKWRRMIVSVLHFLEMASIFITGLFFPILTFSALVFINEADWFTKIQYLCTIVTPLIVHYKICEITSEVFNINDHVNDCLLEFPWYEQDFKLRKKYLIFLTLLEKDLHMNVCGLYQVNMKFFTDNVKRVYSLLNILLLKYYS